MRHAAGPPTVGHEARMPRPRPPHETSSSLLERDALRAEAAALCARAAAGAGGMLAFEGVPGAGKSSLLAAVAEAAEGLCVRHACPLAVERDFPFATARRLLMGPAEPGEVSVPALIDALAVAAARRPMLLIVDDAHWADAASLTWLRCLASRTADLAAAVVLAVRPGEPAALLAHERVTVRTVPPLSRDAVATLLARSHRADVGCAWWATGGNPLLVREFLACSRPVEPGAPMRTTSCLRRIVAARIGRCGAGAARLADATAVLGGMSVAFEHAIGLAGLGRDRAVGAA